MRILVCGSRHFNDYERLKKEVLNALPVGDYLDATIISGHAKGADSLGERLAKDMGWKCEIYPALWEILGKRAGPVRNAQMLSQGKPELVIAFLAEDSVGTKNMIDQSRKAGVKVIVIDVP